VARCTEASGSMVRWSRLAAAGTTLQLTAGQPLQAVVVQMNTWHPGNGCQSCRYWSHKNMLLFVCVGAVLCGF